MTAQTQTETTVWQIDPAHSQAAFSVKHMMISTVRGRFAEISGTITLDEQEIGRSRVEATIPAASITTNDEKRDQHLRSADFLEADTHPALTFVSQSVEPVDDERLRISGDLTIRGVTRPVVLDAALQGRGVNPWGQEVIGFSASTTINRTDFGLQWNVALESGGVLVSEKVGIQIDLEAAKSA